MKNSEIVKLISYAKNENQLETICGYIEDAILRSKILKNLFWYSNTLEEDKIFVIKQLN